MAHIFFDTLFILAGRRCNECPFKLPNIRAASLCEMVEAGQVVSWLPPARRISITLGFTWWPCQGEWGYGCAAPGSCSWGIASTDLRWTCKHCLGVLAVLRLMDKHLHMRVFTYLCIYTDEKECTYAFMFMYDIIYARACIQCEPDAL